MSPKFSGGVRASIAPARRQRASAESAASATAAATSSSSEPLKLTEPHEFKFATTNRGEFHRKQLQQQMALEEQQLAAARERRAQPMPDFTKHTFQPDLTAAHKAPATEVKPFQLRSTLRHADAAEKFEHEKEALLTGKPAEFHALPLPATTYKPDLEFAEPVHDHTHHTVPLKVTLESELRAQKRHEFDLTMGAKMAQLEALQETLAQQKLEQEKQRVQEMRRRSVEEGGLMFKAKPIVTKDQFPTKLVASAPATTPLSPQLRTRDRSSLRSSNALLQPSGNGGGGTAKKTANTTTAKKSASGAGKTLLTSASVDDALLASEHHQQQLAQALSAL